MPSSVSSQSPDRAGIPPRVSVVIPVFNGAKTIGETVESVLAQTFTDFELLVIDDGSTDRTSAVVGGFDDRRIRVRAFPNAGLSASRNRGIAASRGELIAFLDADDVWMPRKLEAQVAALDDQRDAALVYTWVDFISETGAFLGPGLRVEARGMAFDELLQRNVIESGSNAMVRRSAFEEAGLFDANLNGAEDWDMWLRIAARHPIACVPTALMKYRVVCDSMTANIPRQERHSLVVHERAFAVAGPSRRHLKRKALGYLYLYLTRRSVDVAVDRGGALLAARMLRRALWYDPRRVLDVYFVLMACFKIGARLVLPPRLAQAAIERVRRLVKR